MRADIFTRGIQMLKSIFTRYIAAFMTIIVVSFAVLAILVGTMISSHSIDEKRTVTTESSITVKNFFENELSQSETNDIQHFIYYNYANLRRTLTLFTSYEQGLVLILTDINGKVLITDRLADSEYVDAHIPQEIVDEVLKKGKLNATSNMGGLFSQKQIFNAITVSNKIGSDCAIIFAISTEASLTHLSENLIKAVITSMLWVMLAALIVVYILSERITAPLKRISKAAKEFAKGNFKVRVPVKGNDEISQLSESFNNMACDLENHEKTRSAFIANISHDLRTPMTSISGFIDGMLDGAIPPEKHEHYLKIVASEVKRLSRLVSSLLEISKFEAGEKKLVYSEFDICEMARQIVLSFEKKIDEKRLIVDFDCDDFNLNVNADKDSIHQILYNLCDNAVKFSKEGGKYIISIKQKGKRVFVSVYNEGQGISPDDLPFIFDRFYKSDKSRGLDKTGVGLGLFISKTIIEAHNQEIWAKSAYGEYCEFVFTLEKA
ncbi:MAG: HAMP domain-containing histidine kinase [Ruminococcaceae bacterium]|nr:HAMP domain-containing histidine kinase [Oscillospiraceae bacterium]